MTQPTHLEQAEPRPTAAQQVAVVLIHGMGEQRPMETLRRFVTEVWAKDPQLFPAGREQGERCDPQVILSNPDHISGSMEVRRLSTGHRAEGSGFQGPRVDFFELYWADLTSDSKWGDFLTWFSRLLLRKPWRCEVPQRVLLAWGLLWAVSLMIALSLLATAIGLTGWLPDAGWLGELLNWRGWAWIAGSVAAVGWVAKGFLTSTFGDVARYAFAAPRNIKPRREIRKRGLALLRGIADTGDYDRIIVVGHSLGTLLAHDLVMFAWADAVQRLNRHLRDLAPERSRQLRDAIDQCEQAGLRLIDAAGYAEFDYTGILEQQDPCECTSQRLPPERQADLMAFRKAQRRLFEALAKTKIGAGGGSLAAAWLISDLITLGSPLTYAEFLIAQDLCELRHKTYSQEILRCPPITYGPGQSVDWGFSKNPCRPCDNWLHPAAALAPVRWTNIFDASDAIRFLVGDPISGPISRDFGPGVLDVPVQIRRAPWFGFVPWTRRLFTHVWYWRDGRSAREPGAGSATTPEQLLLLRCALNLLDSDDNETALARAATALRQDVMAQ